MILLSVDEIITLHGKLIQHTGGSSELRDYALLESAVYSIMTTFEGVEAYPSVEEKAARLMFSLTNNHAFVDGNKRIGVFTMLMTLQVNDILLQYTQAELIQLSLSVADGNSDYNTILDWICEHKRKPYSK